MAGGFGTTFVTDVLKLFFQAVAIANLADNAASAPNTNLFISLHTASPSGTLQTTSEAAYTGYTRATVARTSGGFTSATNTIAFATLLSFPASTSGPETETHFGVGRSLSGGGYLMFWGTVTPNIAVANGVTPQLTTAAFLSLGT